MRMTYQACMAGAILLVVAATASAQIRITEWMYDGSNGEFIEITNVGNSPIDMTGWSFDDVDGVPGSFSLSILGTLAAHEVAIITEATAVNFRTAWGLPVTLKVAGGNTHNLGRNDTINIYDNNDNLVDTLSYGDQDFPGTIRTQNRSGNPITAAALGADDPSQWALASVGDPYGSFTSAGGQIGNPGSYVVPEPSSILLLLAGCGMLGASRMKKILRRG